jgi:hypothetical protein
VEDGSGRAARRNRAKLAAPAALMAVLVLTGCTHTFPHACEGHGGIQGVVKGIYYCNDGTSIGGGWLWLHPHDRRARP